MTRALLAVTLAVAVGWPALAEAGPSRPNRRARAVKAGARRVIAPIPRARTASTAPGPESFLREALDSIWAGRILRRGVTAVYVVDARTGEDIYAVHADDKINPASNVKLVSTATVLDLLGPTWRYTTRLFGPALDGAGVARGHVYLRGNADPTFATAHIEDLARAAVASGLERVEGDVILSEHLLRDTLSSPRIAITVTAGGVNKPPTVTFEPNLPYIQVHVDAKTINRRRARLAVDTELLPSASEAAAAAVAAAPGTAPRPAPAVDPAAAAADAYEGSRLLIRVSGTIRQGKSYTYHRSVRLRSTFTGHLLRAALRAAGVEVTGRVRLAEFDAYTAEAAAGGWLPVELARHRSKSVEELVARVNKRSTNWLADRLLMTAGAEYDGGGPPSMKKGVEAMHRWLEKTGVEPEDVVLDTGSGLSHKTQITARHLVTVLRAAAGFTSTVTQPKSLLDPSIYLRSLAVGGVDGTLRGRFRGDGLKGQVVAKTGTLRDSVALSGFVSNDEDVLCFAIVTNGNSWNARGRVRREHDQMVTAMKRYLVARADRRRTLAAAEARREAARAAAVDQATSDAAAVGDAVEVMSVQSVRPDRVPMAL
ncbi:MAG TPA: D-alanyl-D-alanine carboxypeptidase/D-alanyl-D-alanine-endopeptidase [Kofleriaceae bacterium]|nr:D-alanyl-D-alanine carboxypeptidase/D-alanyl-D-alanine-endopeptidase [Kofleriaceae bacterium]